MTQKKPLKNEKLHLKLSPIPFGLKNKGVLEFFEWRTTQRLWVLLEDSVFWSTYLKCWIKIPKGFVFDAASIPKILQFIINPVDAVLYGALVHDFIYRFNQLIVCSDEEFGNWKIVPRISRKEADILLRETSIQHDHVECAALICYYALVLFGEFAWKRARKRNFKLLSPYPDPSNIHLQKGFNIPV